MDNSSDDEGLMDFVMKKDISKNHIQPGSTGVPLNRLSSSGGPSGMKIGAGGNSLMGKFSKPSGSAGGGGPSGGGMKHMFIGKTLSIHKHKMKSLNLSSLSKQRLGKHMSLVMFEIK